MIHLKDNGLGGYDLFVNCDEGSGTIVINGLLDSNGGFACGGVSGANGTFTTADSKTVTVSGGIITSIQ